MAVINILDDNTINQIAAGEVVERPVSVVKELVENAMDAKASSISVEIKDGGVGLIRVTDNGSGIESEYIRTAFLRHATSKIKNALDLVTINSLGFRGEALSSISAVSQTEILTKTHNELTGKRYVINGGKEAIFEDVGIPDGTTILVKNLFYNTPARRKFLKSYTTEAGYITELMEKFILSFPNISFKYTVNGKIKLQSSGNNDVKSAIFEIFGRNALNTMISVNIQSEYFSMSGLIAKPEVARGNRNYELYFINNRIVKSKMISSALEEAYKPYLMLHKYPFCVLHFTIDPSRLDVNVHPSKTEIKFLDEDKIYDILVDYISESLHEKEMIPKVLVEVCEDKPDVNTNCDRLIKYIDELTPSKEEQAVKQSIVMPEPFEEKKENIQIDIPVASEIESEQINLFDNDFLSKESIKDHKILGQLFNTYWLVEFDEKLYIIDQHAAHEKVLYERLIKQIRNACVVSQNLYPALIVSLTKSEEEVLKKYWDNFKQIGFEIEHFGQNDYSVRSVPTELFNMSEAGYFLSILDELSTNDSFKSPEAVNDRIAGMACKAAIKGNMSISEREAQVLIKELLSLDNPYNCPHGRPTIVSFSKSDIEKMFKRIV